MSDIQYWIFDIRVSSPHLRLQLLEPVLHQNHRGCRTLRRTDAARRIADAMLQASQQDRHYHDARLRNAYRAGALPAGPAPLPGWWDAPAKRWFEDAYQAGTATGNVAWAALMLLAAHVKKREVRKSA